MNEYLVYQLKQGRIKKGLRQSDVTNETGIKNTTLSNYENGVTEPDIDTFLCLCDLYELDFVSIMEEAYGIKIPGKNFDIKPSEIKHLEKYRSLDSHAKDMVDTILDKEYVRCKTVDYALTDDDGINAVIETDLDQKSTARVVEYAKRLVPNAAHEDKNPSSEDIEHDNDIMDDDNF